MQGFGFTQDATPTDGRTTAKKQQIVPVLLSSPVNFAGTLTTLAVDETTAHQKNYGIDFRRELCFSDDDP